MTIARLNRWIPALNWLALIAILITMFMTFFYAPQERTMGNVQRLFYFHVGSAWVAAVSFFYRPDLWHFISAAGQQNDRCYRCGFGRNWAGFGDDDHCQRFHMGAAGLEHLLGMDTPAD